MAGPNFSIKVPLEDANCIKRALESYRETLEKRIHEAGGVANLPASAQEVMRVEAILRLHF